jgi:hypothetical protein
MLRSVSIFAWLLAHHPVIVGECSTQLTFVIAGNDDHRKNPHGRKRKLPRYILLEKQRCALEDRKTNLRGLHGYGVVCRQGFNHCQPSDPYGRGRVRRIGQDVRNKRHGAFGERTDYAFGCQDGI